MRTLVDRERMRNQLMYHANNKRHICETLRMIYDEVYEMPDSEHKDQATELLIDAMTMAKKMQDRLAYYQKVYHDNTGNKAQNIVYLPGVLERKRKRTERYEKDHR